MYALSQQWLCLCSNENWLCLIFTSKLRYACIKLAGKICWFINIGQLEIYSFFLMFQWLQKKRTVVIWFLTCNGKVVYEHVCILFSVMFILAANYLFLLLIMAIDMNHFSLNEFIEFNSSFCYKVFQYIARKAVRRIDYPYATRTRLPSRSAAGSPLTSLEKDVPLWETYKSYEFLHITYQ